MKTKNSKNRKRKDNISHHNHNRVKKSCHHCRASHLKCDGKRPCARCIGKNRECFEYDPNLIRQNHSTSIGEVVAGSDLDSRGRLFTDRKQRPVDSSSNANVYYLNDNKENEQEGAIQRNKSAPREDCELGKINEEPTATVNNANLSNCSLVSMSNILFGDATTACSPLDDIYINSGENLDVLAVMDNVFEQDSIPDPLTYDSSNEFGSLGANNSLMTS
jgi:hypothetical protein